MILHLGMALHRVYFLNLVPPFKHGHVYAGCTVSIVKPHPAVRAVLGSAACRGLDCYASAMFPRLLTPGWLPVVLLDGCDQYRGRIAACIW